MIGSGNGPAGASAELPAAIALEAYVNWAVPICPANSLLPRGSTTAAWWRGVGLLRVSREVAAEDGALRVHADLVRGHGLTIESRIWTFLGSWAWTSASWIC